MGLRKSFVQYSIEGNKENVKKVYEEDKEEVEKEKDILYNRNIILSLIGKNIRAIRKLQKRTINTLALDAGISAKYLQGVEVGKRNISVTNLDKVAKVLDVSITIFFGNTDAASTKKIFLILEKLKKYTPEQIESIDDFIENFDKIIDE